MHPWSTERAKIAHESEISPPISPRQRAVLGAGAPHGDFVEPLQESNLSTTTSNSNLRRQSIIWNDSNTNNNSTNSDNSSMDDDNTHKGTGTSCCSSFHAHSHPNSPYVHQHHSRQLSSALEPMSTGLLLPRPELDALSSSSSSSASLISSASSSSTSLSSVSSKSSLSHTPSPAHDHHRYHHLTKLETSKQPEFFSIDTPPTSHVPSPSSPSYPTLKGPSLADLKPGSRTSSRAPYHCTQKPVSQIIREISDLVDGRDKTIKVIQYFAKVFLWLFLSNPVQYKVLAARLKALAKQFSTTRKILRLGHFVDPMVSVLTLAVTLRVNIRQHGLRRTLDKTPSQTWRNTVRDRLGSLSSVLGLCQDISDDIYCLGTIGVLDRSFADKAEPWSNRLWMAGVSIDLHENLQSIWDVKKQIKALESDAPAETEEEAEARIAQYTKLRTKLHWLQVTTVKLGGDFLFCAYDNLHCSFSDGFQAVTGFISGLAGAYKFVGKVMES
ncbi:hypothetical protein BC939DRAFT_438426 [Gamsiella multidivaricata]|uniref:uncharacterized protein n=1 Tax=Gamsiella multidivaricata TaxID=101098 RepID=UPI00221ECB93|nr:uncharacterized protein BC939DRAFT_438426 [Gamsiella multidivaricata]KAG0367842.1 Peroxisomal membrane protein PMP27 [Gamsiella multidivaricata]KAI7830586.1 hypothetical protein BC939DRAFT_438426 [Gamsiella multidivaricata]